MKYYPVLSKRKSVICYNMHVTGGCCIISLLYGILKKAEFIGTEGKIMKLMLGLGETGTGWSKCTSFWLQDE